jgi:hypothetical protein
MGRYEETVAEIYRLEGQVPENDPRIQTHDNRCPECLATLNEPKKLTPVRRQAHEFLQSGKHFKSCSRAAPNTGTNVPMEGS